MKKLKWIATLLVMVCVLLGGIGYADTVTDEGSKIIVPETVLVQGGTITGATYTNNWTGVFIEGRTVTLSDFFMGKYEVTQEEYASVMEGQTVTVDGTEYTLESNPNYCTADSTFYTLFSGDEQGKRPVEGVSWYDAVWYCNALSEKEGLTKAYSIEVTQVTQEDGKTGYYISNATVTLNANAKGYRLPTEAEWEYAARGGDPEAADWNYVFSGADTAEGVSYGASKKSALDSVGWYLYNSINGTTGDTSPSRGGQGCGTHQVGKKAPNRLGLYDMSGNVWEWCYDWYGTVNTGEESDPTGAASGSYRVFRGGSWISDAGIASVSSRRSSGPSSFPCSNYGFRVVRSGSRGIGYADTVTDEGSKIENGSTTPEGFVLIPAGSFKMGSNDGYDDNKPVHEVTITKPFYMGKHEITQGEYEKYCTYGEDEPNSEDGEGANYPAYNVSWYDALVYCNKRSIAEELTPCYSINGSTDPEYWGEIPEDENYEWDEVICNWKANGYRLPTEAEWEYAARAGDNTVEKLIYSGTNDEYELEDYAWYYDNSNVITHKVGTKKPNAFGLYDMSGNVWEWCWNWYTSSYDTTTEGGNDPTGAASGSDRVLRGGSWFNFSDLCAVSNRRSSNPVNRINFFGFRVVRSGSNYVLGVSGYSNLSGPDNGGTQEERFVLIPAGSFKMGSNDRWDDNKPVHEVTITKPFYMGKYEVTQAEYEKYCSYGSDSPSSSYGDGDNYPAYWVTWYDALIYCNKRSMAEGLTPCYSINDSTDPKDWGEIPSEYDDSNCTIWDAVECNWNANGYRLPTEAEWEYAARAGDNTVDSLTYSGTSDVNELEKYAGYYDNSNTTLHSKTHEVGTKKANAFGLYDMSGNVLEWCWNWYTNSYDTEVEGGSDPTGSSAGSGRVYRGGSWGLDSDFCAVSCRNYFSPSLRSNCLGFRVVRASSN